MLKRIAFSYDCKGDVLYIRLTGYVVIRREHEGEEAFLIFGYDESGKCVSTTILGFIEDYPYRDVLKQLIQNKLDVSFEELSFMDSITRDMSVRHDVNTDRTVVRVDR